MIYYKKEIRGGGGGVTKHSMKAPLSNSFVFEPCDPMEVKTLIAQRNASKATGPNGVPTEILQLINNEVCEPLRWRYP